MTARKELNYPVLARTAISPSGSALKTASGVSPMVSAMHLTGETGDDYPLTEQQVRAANRFGNFNPVGGTSAAD